MTTYKLAKLGAPMTRCATCGFDNPPAMKFCGGCGRPLVQTTEAEAERRQLTVMFCDLVGSTALADALDPEELRELVQTYQQAAGNAIRTFEGYIAQHLGDGLLVYFGYPVAHEDDARRAVHAALAVLDGIATLNTTLPAGRTLSLRIGIHTGPVVTGEIGAGQSRERLALGPTPNVAARLQEMAQPNTVVVSRQTCDLLKGAFTCESLGPQTLKGFAHAVDVFRIAGRAAGAGRPQTPMIGRRRELEALAAMLEQVRRGYGQAAMVVAEAGLGKSRLVQAFHEYAAAAGCEWHGASCSPYEQNSALRPVAACLRRVLGFADDTIDAPHGNLMADAIGRAGLDVGEAVPLMAGLLGMPTPSPYGPSLLSPQKQRARTLEIAAALLAAPAADGPVVVLLEDLHWADPSTVDFLRILIERCAGVPLLTLLTSRPVGGPALNGALQRIVLGPVGADEVAGIATGVARGKRLPLRVIEQIVAKTDGVPLFVEELTKSILESGALREEGDRFELAGAAGALSIPLSLHASLIARLDRLPSGKDVAQLASVIGREFSFEMLQATAQRPAHDLMAALDRLVEAELLYRAGTPPNATYLFKHALVQDAAYDMLLKSTRREYHARIAAALVERFPDIGGARPELVAQHLTEAGQAEPAAGYWLKAGQRAMQQSANQEAESHLRRGLALVEPLPASGSRDTLELGLLASLGSVLAIRHGYSAAEAEEVYRRAQRLSERMEYGAAHSWITIGILIFRLVRAELREVTRIAGRLFDEARARHDAAVMARAESFLVWADFYHGNFADGRRRAEALMRTMPPEDIDWRNHLGGDLYSNVHWLVALNAWHLGDLARAREYRDRSLQIARDTRHPYVIATAVNFAGIYIDIFARDFALVRQHAAELLDLSERHGFGYWLDMTRLRLAWAEELGRAGPPQLASAVDPCALIDQVKLMRVVLGNSDDMTTAAEVLMHRGRLQEADALLDEALQHLQTAEDQMWAAETHRVKAEILLRRGGDPPDSTALRNAERFLTRALEIARSQGSRSLELRVAIDLGRLWRGQGRQADARALVAGVVDTFPPDVGAYDLEAGRAFLRESAVV